MGFLRNITVTLGTIAAILVVIVLGMIGYFIYQMLGIILTGLVMFGLIWYIFFGEKPKPPSV